jgi:hypothetical protein
MLRIPPKSLTWPSLAPRSTQYDADETAIIERVLREYGGTIPDAPLISEAALALAIHRRHPAD